MPENWGDLFEDTQTSVSTKEETRHIVRELPQFRVILHNDDINTTLDTLSAAIDSLRAQSSKFGSNLSVVETRQNFTKETINTLETGAANLTLADSNEEAANLLALQTRQQLSSTSLSLASQADQQVLRLF